MFSKDENHKAYMSIKHQSNTINTLFSKEVLSKNIQLNNSSYFSSFIEFIKEGIVHIFIGIDHILFLVALLLPSVFILQNRKWRPNNSLKITLIHVLKIVTAFTIAHSITLSLSILGLISLESWLIESLIAFSVILAGINNIFPRIEKKIWILVFIFGLIHGMGFASVLNELELANHSKFITLLGFNIGVELGQIFIVATIVPLIYLLRNRPFYQPFILKFGSFLIVLMGIIWFYERVT
jgi:hydrogenase/urease accessory protein HupE